MRTNIIAMSPLGYVSRFLGMASALLGWSLAMMWGLAFVVIVANLEFKDPLGGSHPAEPPMQLPIELPLVGLALGALGWLIARVSRQPVARPSIAGVITNAVPLVLAVLLIVIHALTR